MKDAKDVLRNHLLAATMLGRWETLTEMKRAVCKETGASYLRMDVWRWLRELSIDGTHKLDYRHRPQTEYKEYRLRVRPDAIAPVRGTSLSIHERNYRLKPVRFTWPKPAMR